MNFLDDFIVRENNEKAKEKKAFDFNLIENEKIKKFFNRTKTIIKSIKEKRSEKLENFEIPKKKKIKKMKKNFQEKKKIQNFEKNKKIEIKKDNLKEQISKIQKETIKNKNLKEIVKKFPKLFPLILQIKSTTKNNLENLKKMEINFKKEKTIFFENYEKYRIKKNTNFEFLQKYIFELKLNPLEKFGDLIKKNFLSFFEKFISNLEKEKNLKKSFFFWIYYLSNIQKCPLDTNELFFWNSLIKILVLKKIDNFEFSKDIDFLIIYLKLNLKSVLW